MKGLADKFAYLALVLRAVTLLPQCWRDKLARGDGPLPTPCWMWTGWNSANGYGKVKIEGRAHMAHRAIYERLVGPIPACHVLDHRCRNRACCNPAHLEPVTVRENTHRGNAVLFEKREPA